MLAETGTVDLPTYAFDRARYWPSAGPGGPAAEESPGGADAAFWAAVEREDLAALAELTAQDATESLERLGAALPVLAGWRRQQRDRSTLDGLRYRGVWQPYPGTPVGVLSGTWWIVADERRADEGEAAVAELARTGRPVVAEGAGLLWLARELDGLPMCGVLDAVGASRDGLVVGYREATAAGDSVVARAGATVVGHKQHAAVLTPRSGERAAWRWEGGAPEGFVWRGVHASQLVPHWAAHPEIAARLVAAAVAPAEAPA
ncbi:Hydrogenobyrinate a,c-diamide synthase [Micromonospora sp. MH33]|nr:Hydrogenobyrinate a,c-diamide synthase [Micromonospora sp. MH33]